MTIPIQPAGVTIDKYGVSAKGSKGQGPLRQPRVKYRYRVIFLGFGGAGGTGEAITLNTNTCGLPTLTHDSIEVNSFNSKSYFDGKHTWGDISLTVRDTVDNSVQKAIGAQMQMQLDHYNQTGYRAGANYKFTTLIQLLDGNHDTYQTTWTLEGCFLKEVAFGELDYASSEVVTINMTLRPDNCIEEDSSGQNSLLPTVGTDPLSSFIN